MVMVRRKVTWTKLALRQLTAAIKYIRKHSPQNADSVKQRILNKVDELADTKIVHRRDPNRTKNDGSFFYFEILKFRILYHAEPGEVFILRIRHTKREPKK
ncbi:MAG: type II toxin-antitoxin system RelE/ParE family toxin [Chitinophagaceae bacterium]|nr:type II toxin-antitoxin system RelE/ParE family toxin [Chitinophagaceae bacterium]